MPWALKCWDLQMCAATAAVLMELLEGTQSDYWKWPKDLLSCPVMIKNSLTFSLPYPCPCSEESLAATFPRPGCVVARYLGCRVPVDTEHHPRGQHNCEGIGWHSQG